MLTDFNISLIQKRNLTGLLPIDMYCIQNEIFIEAILMMQKLQSANLLSVVKHKAAYHEIL